MKLMASSKSWILLSTALVIGIAFSVYFLVYVKGNEKEIVANNFRVLQQIVSNINQLEQSFLKNAEIRSLADSNAVELNTKIMPAGERQCIDVINSTVEGSNTSVIYGSEGIFFKVDTIINPNDNFACAHYFTDYEAFFSNELFQRKDVFDQIIIYKTIEAGQGAISGRSVLYSNTPLGVMDSLFHRKFYRSAKDIISINDKEFVSFNQVIDDQDKILISGLVLKSTFEQQKRSVSPFVIFSLSVALVLIILAMPILKLKIMSMEERLHVKDVVFGVISVLVGPAVFIVFLNASFIFSGIEKNQSHSKLEDLSIQLEQNFQTEIDRLINQIDQLNSEFRYLGEISTLVDHRFNMDQETKEMFSSKFGNPLSFDSSQYEITGFKVYDGIIEKELVTLKHLKAAFWCTNEAQILIFLSVFKNPGYAQDLSHRKYITNIIDDKPDFFRDSDKRIHEVAIESIKSVNDGSYEIGVGKSTGWKDLPVMAISARLSSTMGTIMEEGYGFCILDEEGNTIFHSDITKNMNENFIEETQEVFKPSIKSHISKYETINYNGKNQTIFLRPLDCLSGHYIATFVNTEVYRSPITLSMVSSFTMFLFYLVFILSIYLVLYYSNFKLSKLKQTTYIFNFIRPYETSYFYRKYRRLQAVTVMVIAYTITSIAANGKHYDFIVSELVLMVVTLIICSMYSLSNGMHDQLLNQEGFKKPSRKLFTVLWLAIVLILVFRVVSIIVHPNFDFLLLLNAVLGIMVAMYMISELFYEDNVFRFSFFEVTTDNPKRIQRSYITFLLLWVILMSIIPMNLFIKIAYEKETEIFAKYRSLELFKNIDQWDNTSRIEFDGKFYSQRHYDQFIASMRMDSINYALVETTFKVDSIKPSIDYQKHEVQFLESAIKVRSVDSTTYRVSEIDIVSDDSIFINGRICPGLDVTKMSFYGDYMKVRDTDSITYEVNEVKILAEGGVRVLSKGLLINDMKESRISDEIAKVEYLNRDIYDKVYKLIRPIYNERSEESKSFVDNVSSDNSWIFSSTKNKKIFTYNPGFTKTASLTSVMIPEHGFFEDHLFSIIFVIVISILILYKFLSFIIIKIYGFKFRHYAEYVERAKDNPLGKKLLLEEHFSNDSSYNNIFMVGVNTAHTTPVKEYFPAEGDKKLLILDFYDFTQKMSNETANDQIDQVAINRFDRAWEAVKHYHEKGNEQVYVLVEHFEFGYNDIRMNQLKLEILKYLIDDSNFKVIVKSEINATKLLDFYEDSIKNIELLLKKTNVEDRLSLQEKLELLRVDFNKWQHLLGSFVKYIIPMNTFSEHEREKTDVASKEQKNPRLEEELKHGEFLNMVNAYVSSSPVDELPYEDQVLTIQQMSYPYYFAVWNSLSREERYLVYDIAKDRFVNTVNTNAILSLMMKGILIYDHSLRLMNDSFANFVLTKVNSDEALEMEMESRKKGTWNTAFAVILLLVISIVIFLSIGQQGFLNDLNAFLTAIAALIGLLIRFSGFFSFGAGKAVST